MLEGIDVNTLIVLVLSAVHLLIGLIWYSEAGFKLQWMKEAGLTKTDIKERQKKGTGGMLVVAYLMGFLAAFSIGWVISLLDITTIFHGAHVGLIMWIGFVFPATIGPVLWEGRSLKLWVINNSYWLVSFILMGSVMAVWK